MLDLAKLAKLMELSASPIDGEALNSIRIANKMLLENNISWSQFVAEKTLIIQEVQQIIAKPSKPDVDVEKMLSECIVNVTSSTGLAFIRSLNDFYKTKGFLTPKQKEALKKWYDNV